MVSSALLRLNSAKYPLRAGRCHASRLFPLRLKEVIWSYFARRLLGHKQYPQSDVAVLCQAARLHHNVELSQGSPLIAAVTQQFKESQKVESIIDDILETIRFCCSPCQRSRKWPCGVRTAYKQAVRELGGVTSS